MPRLIEPTQAVESITLRAATPADASALAGAAAAFFSQTFGPANRSEDMKAYLAEAFSEEGQRAHLRDPDQRVWLALDATGAIVGYAHVRLGAAPSGASAIASVLMRACVEAAREWGGDLLWLGVWEHNPRAIAFYGKHGFRPVGEQEFLLGTDRQRDIVMARDLTTER